MARFLVILLAAFALSSLAPMCAHAQYEIVPQGTPVRWNFWLSDGPARINSTDTFWGNHFQIGADAHFLKDYRLILGLTLIDLLSSGETSSDVGNISRYGFDLRVGVF